ncbi:MAG: hypothetical protein OEY14_09570, partial [Myxococcales bacterium]|nr:hypothetical protein [Myxococcales bacterium]
MTLASRMRWTEPVHSAQVNDAPRIRCGHRRTLARSGALGLALALIALSAPRGAIAQADPVDPVDPPAPAPSDPGADASPPASPGEPPDAPREGAGGLGGGLGAAPADSPPAPEAEPEAIPAAPGAVPPAPGASPPGQSATLRLIVIDAAPYQVDPAVGRHVSHRLRVTAAEMGYAVLTAEQSVAAAQALRMPYPPAPADLWRVTHAAGAERGVFARVWAHQGLYVVEVVVASLDG